MSKVKTYEVVVTTTEKWFGTVEAKSRSAARRIGEDQFNEGEFRQIYEQVVNVKVCEVRS